MEHKVFIHIGPPKTGTTSLQYALQRINCPDFFYGGIYQPRNCLQYFDLGKQIYHLVQDRRNKFDRKLLLSKIEQLGEKFSVLFFSEEMFLLHQPDFSIEEKLRKLRDFLGEHELIFLYSYREPESAIPSLYQELYKELSSRYVNNYFDFIQSNYTKCYDFDHICSLAKEINVELRKINIFELSKKSNVCLSDILDDTSFNSIALDFPVANKGKRRNGVRVLERDTPLSKRIKKIRQRIEGSRFGENKMAITLGHFLERLEPLVKHTKYFDPEQHKIE